MRGGAEEEFIAAQTRPAREFANELFIYEKFLDRRNRDVIFYLIIPLLWVSVCNFTGKQAWEHETQNGNDSCSR